VTAIEELTTQSHIVKNYVVVPVQTSAGLVRNLLEHRMGFEPMNTGFADQRVSHFATGASAPPRIPATENVGAH
jgi:hypothetical protein